MSTIIRILRLATTEERVANFPYEGFDPNTGVLFFGKPKREPKYYFSHNGVKYTLFRAKKSRLNGVYRGTHNGQVSLVLLEREGFKFYQIVSGETPFFIQMGKEILPSGNPQVYGLYYYPSRDILIHY